MYFTADRPRIPHQMATGRARTGTSPAHAMSNAEDSELITTIARDILAEVAPQEIPIFPAVSRAYFADPARALKLRRTGDAALGFGADALAVFLTPAVLHILSAVCEILMEAAKKAVTDGLAKEIPEALKAMLKRFGRSAASMPSPLGKVQLEQIHASVLLEAKKLQLPDDKIEAIANAVTAHLIIGA
jgi:hypothetical protein